MRRYLIRFTWVMVVLCRLPRSSLSELPAGRSPPSNLAVLIKRQPVLVRDRRPQRDEGLLVLRSLVVRCHCGLVAGIGPVVGAATVGDLVLRPAGEVLVRLGGCLPGQGEILQHRGG